MALVYSVVIFLIIYFIGFELLIKPFVKFRSQRYQRVLDLNAEYIDLRNDFPDVHEKTYYFDTKAKYDSKNNKNKVFDSYIYENKENLLDILDMLDENLEIKEDYEEAFKELLDIPAIRFLSFIENKLIKRVLLKFKVDFALIYDFRYRSPKGRNNYLTTKILRNDDLLTKIDDLEKSHVEKTEYEASRDAERAKLTSGLRYDILKRDNFTCRVCGASSLDHGVTLHVDHIYPISKGGKTVEKNLQTLCMDCNLGKSNKI